MKQVFFSFAVTCECETVRESEDSMVVFTVYSEKGKKPGITITNNAVELTLGYSVFIDLMYSGDYWTKYFKLESTGGEFFYIKPLKKLPFTISEVQTGLTNTK